jgi:exonuclease SbcD
MLSIRGIPGAKGAMLVRVADGIVRNIEARACDEVRWARIASDASDASDMTELLQGLARTFGVEVSNADARPLAARLTVSARGELKRRLLADPAWFQAEVQNQASIVSDSLWIEKVTIDGRDNEPMRGLPPELAELLAAAIEDPDCLRVIQEPCRCRSLRREASAAAARPPPG